MVEYFVHIDPDDPPKDLVVVTAEVPNNVLRQSIAPKELPVGWRSTPAPPELAAIGDAFARDGRTAIFNVPSALAPAESNWLINPQHPHFVRIRVHPPKAFEFDSRFFQS